MDPAKSVMKAVKSGMEIRSVRPTVKSTGCGWGQLGPAAITGKLPFIQFIPPLVTYHYPVGAPVWFIKVMSALSDLQTTANYLNAN